MSNLNKKYKIKGSLRLKPDLGKLIREERVKLGKTVEECAALGGLSAGHWSALETRLDVSKVNLRTADRLAAGLGKTLMFFVKNGKG